MKIEGKSLCDKIKDLESLVALEKSFNKKLLEEIEQIKNQKQLGARRWSTNTSPFSMEDVYRDEDGKGIDRTRTETTN